MRKKHSRSLIITLLDLKNAFGEVHHELIKTALRYHHVPNSFIDLFDNIYNDATISISVEKEQTGKMKVLKGVLQGDPCSPLLFNLVFNTLMQTLLKQTQFETTWIYLGTKSVNV